MEFHFKIIGTLLIALALIHIIFPKYFHWKAELSQLSLINRQMMYVHTLFIAITVLLIGILCLTSSTELVTTDLGKKISLGLGLFWSIRLVVQFVGYSSALWRGKTFETTVHIFSVVLWMYLSVIFFMNFRNF